MPTTESDRILVGKVAGFFGLQGWVKIHSHTEPKDNILSYKKWWLKNSTKKDNVWIERDVLKIKNQGKGLVALFDGINDRTQAEILRGLDIYIDADQLDDLPEGEYYWKDLIGLQVVNEQGYRFGKVLDVMATGANDVLVVQGKETDAKVLAKREKDLLKKKSSSKNAKTKIDIKETLIPYIWEQVIKQVDLEKQEILVAWDEDYLAD